MITRGQTWMWMSFVAILPYCGVSAQELKASDFLKAADSAPDASVKVTTVPNKEVGQDVITARAADGKIDDVNTVRAANTQLKANAKSGTRVIATASGMGVVAYGRASYSTTGSNPNLVAMGQRLACVEADLIARTELAKFLNGCTVEQQIALSKRITTIDTAATSMANVDKSATESLSTSISAMLRGAVTYDMDDDPSAGKVSVSVVASPRTLGAIQSTGSATIEVAQLEEGVQFILSAIENQVVPPVGGRFILVPATGQMAWIGFGSEYWSTNSNSDVESELESVAEGQAQARAEAALLGIINGENVTSNYESSQKYASITKQYDEITGAALEGGEKTQAECSKIIKRTLGVSRVGKLPPGVMSKRFERGRWKVSVAVFNPEVTAEAKKLAETMAKTSPLKVKAKGVIDSFKTNPDGSFQKDAKGNLIPESLGSGQVTDPKDL